MLHFCIPYDINYIDPSKNFQENAEKWRSHLSAPGLSLQDLDNLMTSFMAAVEDGSHLEAGWPSGLLASYCVSKMGVSALARVLARTMGDTVVVNHVHPGYVITDMTRHYSDGAQTALPMEK